MNSGFVVAATAVSRRMEETKGDAEEYLSDDPDYVHICSLML